MLTRDKATAKSMPTRNNLVVIGLMYMAYQIFIPAEAKALPHEGALALVPTHHCMLGVCVVDHCCLECIVWTGLATA